MLGKILGSGQLGKLASFVSPAFFEVMPAGALWTRARRLYALTRDHAAFDEAVAVRSAALATALPQLKLTSGLISAAVAGSAPQAPRIALDPDTRAALVVELFFRQLFQPVDPAVSLLDLRATAFAETSDGLLWKPAPWIAEWSSDFIEPLRELYRGFYEHDDAQFRRGLAALSLTHSEDLFRTQFGADQARVYFRTQEFIAIFHEVFMRCKAHRTKLHPDFLPLGIYLAALYDHAQELGVAVDVNQAFARAMTMNSAKQESTHA